jgi:hypothetical protein
MAFIGQLYYLQAIRTSLHVRTLQLEIALAIHFLAEEDFCGNF